MSSIDSNLRSRTVYSTGAPWESVVGYARAVRTGNIIEVSGTCAVDATGVPVHKNDPYLQAYRCLEIIRDAILALGGQLSDVSRTRMYVKDITMWEEIGKAHGEFFKEIRPATTMVQVAGLISPEFLVEIEATAIINV